MSVSLGPNLPIAIANNAAVGTEPWTGPPSAPPGSGSVGLNGETSNYLDVSSFGFTVPPTALVVGIQADVEWGAGAGFAENSVKLIKGGTVSGSDRSTGAAAPGTFVSPGSVTYGGPTDTWGLSFTAADVNSSGFGLAFSVLCTLNDFARVVQMQLTVFYEIPIPVSGGIAGAFGMGATYTISEPQTAHDTFAFGLRGLPTTTSRATAQASKSFQMAATAKITPPPPTIPFAAPKAPLRFTYYSYDLLTGRLVGSTPMRGVSFGQQLNAAGPFTSTLDMMDPGVQKSDFIGCTVPNRTLLAVDYGGTIVWAGIVMTRVPTRTASLNDTTNTLAVQASESWVYFGSRDQATDYSAPPFSGINTPVSGPMSLWRGTPWDASLIACQVIGDALGVTNGDLLGGLGVLLNGSTPSDPVADVSDWVAVTYPFTSTQTIDTIVSQLAELGLGVGFDFGVDVAYSDGPGSAPIGTINLSYPRRGRTVAQSHLVIDLTTARSYSFPEDGTQTANQIYEVGGSGAIVVDANIDPLSQGYPLWERVISRANAQSQNIEGLLQQCGVSDLALYSYAPVAPTVTLGIDDPNLPLGSFVNGDDVQVLMPAKAADGGVYDARFPAGMDQEWRIVQWQANVADEGDSTVVLTLNQPPFLRALAPAV